MADKKSFVMYVSWATMIAELPTQQAGELCKAICAHQIGKEYTIEDQVVAAIYGMIIEQMDADTEAYTKTCEKRAEASAKAVKKRREQLFGNQKEPNGNQMASSGNQKESNGNQMVGDNESDSESESDSDKEGIPPISPLVIPNLSAADLASLGCAPMVAEKLADWIANQSAKHQTITEMDLRSIVSRAKAATQKHGASATAKVIEDSLQYKAIIWDRLESRARDKPKGWEVTQKTEYEDDLESKLLVN